MTGKRELRRAGLVVFDCDSTLSALEGIDELASSQRAQIEELTAAAMRGDVSLESVYGERLARIRPTRGRLDDLARRYIEAIVPDAREVVRALAAEGVRVRIMSGGLLPAVRALAEVLGVGAADVAAVDITFDDAGEYTAFDTNSPLARSLGKRELLLEWRADVDGDVIMVGDGITDVEAGAVADLFVAYAGVVARAEVIAAADVVIRSPSLAPVLPLALAGARPRTAESVELFEKGRALLERDNDVLPFTNHM